MISFHRAQRALADFNSGSREVRARAGRVLSEYLEERGAPVASATAPRQSSTTSTATAAPVARAFSQADLDAAFARGVRSERDRVSAVFASEHSRGRERGCAALLTASPTWSASAILQELPSLPTDQARGATSSGRTSAERWERANATAQTNAGASGEAAVSTAQPQGKSAASRWDKANAKVGSTTA
jgi:hypothetical protein